MTQRGAGTIAKRGKIWWVQICVDGLVIRQSSKSEKYADAKRLRDKLLGQRERGELGGHNARLSVDGLLNHFVKALAVRVRPDTLKIQSLVIDANLRPFFGNMKGDKITTDILLKYRQHRADEGRSPSTANRELSLLRNCLRTAAHSTPPLLPLTAIPRFPITNEDGCARQGFLEDVAFDRLIAELPGYLVPLTTVAYNTGIRKGELLKMGWDQVDLDGDVLLLYRGETKSGKPRTLPMLGDMRAVLLRAREDRDANFPDCDRLFHRLGEPIKDFRGAWESACERAGVADLNFHDLRRSGARNLSRAGIPETVIMKITGHRTRSMFDTYNVTSEEDLAEAAVKLKAYRDAKRGSTPKFTDTISGTEPKTGSGS
jgi:integrase